MTDDGRPLIVVLDDYEHALHALADWSGIERRARVRVEHAPLYGDALLERIVDASAIVLQRDRTPFPAELSAQLPELRYLVFTGSRNTALDLDALRRRGIPVSFSGRAATRDGTCEIAWALIFAATKRLEAQFSLMRAGGWRDAAGGLPGSLAGRRLGIVGLGDIGRQMARIGQAFGMEVVAWSPHMTAERARECGCESVPLDELLSGSAVVSLHIVPGESTRRLLDRERLALMGVGSILVNTARAELIDTAALIDALDAGRPGVAALDVFDTEPLEFDHPLRRRADVVLTPHLGFVTRPVLQTFATGVVECLTAWLDGAPLPRTLGC